MRDIIQSCRKDMGQLTLTGEVACRNVAYAVYYYAIAMLKLAWHIGQKGVVIKAFITGILLFISQIIRLLGVTDILKSIGLLLSSILDVSSSEKKSYIILTTIKKTIESKILSSLLPKNIQSTIILERKEAIKQSIKSAMRASVTNAG